MDSEKSQLVDELESEIFLNEVIESNREMDNLLLESDFALQTAEFELKATIKENTALTSEDETSSVLSIEVSEDLFKGHISDINYSPIHFKPDVEKQNQSILTNNLNNLLDEFNSSLKHFNETFKQNLNASAQNETDDTDKTITAQNISNVVKNQELDINKTVTVKSLLDSDEEHDYIYVDMYKTIEISVPNIKENMTVSEKPTLNNYNHFEGCSHNFKSTIINDYTLIIDNDVQINCSSDIPKIEIFDTKSTEALLQNNKLNNNEQIIHSNTEITVQSDPESGDSQQSATKVVEQLTLNENNNIITEHAKRSLEDSITLDNPKKIKLDEDLNNSDENSSNSNEVIITDNESINFTEAIFDPQETADHNDPKWSVLKELETNEDYFKSVRTQWRSLSLPNPHKTNTTRYVPENIAKIKPETETSDELNHATTVNEYLEKRIYTITKEINDLNCKLNSSLRYASSKDRKKIHNRLEELRNLKHEVEKNQEEVKHINMFYYNDSQGWNANYLTRSQLSELQEQDKLLEFQKNFYKS